MSTLDISDCDNLTVTFDAQNQVHLQVEEDSDEINVDVLTSAEIIVHDITQLWLKLDSSLGFTVKLENVDTIHVLPKDEEGDDIDEDIISWMGITFSELYFYLVIVLASVLLVVVFVIIPTVVICVKKQ